MSVVELFCRVDDFWQQHGPLWRQPQLFHVSDYDKAFPFVRRVRRVRSIFPNLENKISL